MQEVKFLVNPLSLLVIYVLSCTLCFSLISSTEKEFMYAIIILFLFYLFYIFLLITSEAIFQLECNKTDQILAFVKSWTSVKFGNKVG